MEEENRYCYKYPRPAVTTDCVVFGFGEGELKVLLIERGAEPFKGCWALPGGFMEMDEDADTCARRELQEETGLEEVYMEQLYTFSAVDRDPRHRVVSIAYYALVKLSDYVPEAGDDARRAKWFPLSGLPSLAFDHQRILQMALDRLKGKYPCLPMNEPGMKTLLLVVDMQNDFCMPEGALYVPGAEADVRRLSAFLRAYRLRIDAVWLTQDNHQVMDIAHPVFWESAGGEQPSPFTTITCREVEEGIWIPRTAREEVLGYLKDLEANGDSHTVWPVHCIWGSEGAAIAPVLMEGVEEWARQGKYFRVLGKGMHPLTEHFGAFRANVPRADAPETALNRALIGELDRYDTIWVAGEARSHCVAQSIKQLLDFPQIVKKLVILEDCMSPVAGCEDLATSIYEAAVAQGARMTTTTTLMSDL